MLNAKQTILSVLVICGLIFGIYSINAYVKNKVSQKVQETAESAAKEKAEIKLQCETSKLESEAELKKRIVELESELEKSKILIEKIKKQGVYTELMKKDVSKFMKELDGLLDIKGKVKDDKK